MDNRPIGFMDSGVGGLTVVSVIKRMLPNEQVIFIGDEARMPYGPRPKSEVRKFADQMTDFLIKKNIKALVIACNTATSAAYEELSKRLSIPVFGVIQPGSVAAVAKSVNKKIGVIATIGTINSHIYQEKITDLDNESQVYELACQEFVTIVENNEAETPATFDKVKAQLQLLTKTEIDTLVLGCTHFPHLRKAIQAAVGTNVTLIDPGEKTIQDLKDQLLSDNTQHDDTEAKSDEYYTTGHLKEFTTIGETLLNDQIHVEKTILE